MRDDALNKACDAYMMSVDRAAENLADEIVRALHSKLSLTDSQYVAILEAFSDALSQHL